MADRSIETLIEASSLGTPAAKALRAATPPDVARQIVERSKRVAAGVDGSDESYTSAEPNDLGDVGVIHHG